MKLWQSKAADRLRRLCLVMSALAALSIGYDQYCLRHDFDELSADEFQSLVNLQAKYPQIDHVQLRPPELLSVPLQRQYVLYVVLLAQPRLCVVRIPFSK